MTEEKKETRMRQVHEAFNEEDVKEKREEEGFAGLKFIRRRRNLPLKPREASHRVFLHCGKLLVLSESEKCIFKRKKTRIDRSNCY